MLKSKKKLVKLQLLITVEKFGLFWIDFIEEIVKLLHAPIINE